MGAGGQQPLRSHARDDSMLRRPEQAEAITVKIRDIRSTGGPQREMWSPRSEPDGVRSMPPRRPVRPVEARLG
jgi:hypothetical protein